MKDNLAPEYQRRIRGLFKETNKLFKDISFGAHKNIITSTVPFMVLEKWREDGHSSDIPLLDEAVKNVVLATAALFFGWTKTSCLHLRVVLENVFSGVSLLMSPRSLSAYSSRGVITYKRFKDLVVDYEKANTTLTKICHKFNVKSDALNLYSDLSNWSHTLGSEFVCDLSILGHSKLNNATIGKMKTYFQTLVRVSSIVYLSAMPNMFGNISQSHQRLFLGYISKEERKLLREMTGL
ncbi:MAG: hypothetical protein ABSC54_08445 [Smithellaceae bacterium]